jgi:hypothetical protein
MVWSGGRDGEPGFRDKEQEKKKIYRREKGNSVKDWW